MALWLIPRRDAPDAQVTLTERECSWADSLGAQRAEQFAHSRRWLRSCLADRFRLCSDRIPLEAPPGHPPTLAAGWGWISISHTRDALLLGWSSQRIGVDLERHDRSFAAEALCRRFFCADDRDALLRLAAAERPRVGAAQEHADELVARQPRERAARFQRDVAQAVRVELEDRRACVSRTRSRGGRGDARFHGISTWRPRWSRGAAAGAAWIVRRDGLRRRRPRDDEREHACSRAECPLG